MSTTVSGILRDSTGQLWTNAPVQLIFQVTPGAAGPFVWSGGAFNGKPPIVISDPLTAAFTITVPANNEIVPANSYWQIIIGPGATFPAFVLNVHLVTGSLDISTLFGTQASLGFTQSMAVPRAYADSEVIVPPNSGQLYYDVTNKALKFFENGIWNALATGGGAPVMVYPAAGIGVSTGTAWTTSIDPATVPRLNTANTFIADQTITGKVSSSFYLVTGTFTGPWNNGIALIDMESGNDARLMAKSNNTNIGGIQFAGASDDADGRFSVYANFAEPTGSGSARAHFFSPIEVDGKATVNGHLTVISFGLGATISSGTQQLNIDISPADHTARILSINPSNSAVTGAYNIGSYSSDFSRALTYLNMYDDGDLGQVQLPPNFSVGGNATFNGFINANTGLLVSGLTPGRANAITIQQTSNNAYFDSVGSAAGTRGAFNFRCLDSAGTGGSGPDLVLNQTGATFLGNVYCGVGISDYNNLPTKATGLTIGNNVTGYGEVPFVNSSDGQVAFAWYAVPPNTTVTTATVQIASLDKFGSFYAHNTISCGGTKAFKITHPLDETKDLWHGCLEGPEVGVYYRGEATTDAGGQVLLFLPDYFEALTFIEDRSVQLTVIDDGSLNFPLLKSTAVEAGSFVVYSSISNTKFYWEVKAVRKIGVSRLEVVREKEIKPKGE